MAIADFESPALKSRLAVAVAVANQPLPLQILARKPDRMSLALYGALAGTTCALGDCQDAEAAEAEYEQLCDRPGVTLSEFVRSGAMACAPSAYFSQRALELMAKPLGGVHSTVIHGNVDIPWQQHGVPHVFMVINTPIAALIYDPAAPLVAPGGSFIPNLSEVPTGFLSRLRRTPHMEMARNLIDPNRSCGYGVVATEWGPAPNNNLGWDTRG